MRACEGDFLARIDLLARAKVDAIILREKHLSEAEYKALAKEVMKICQKHGALCVLHHFYEAALSLGSKAFHCPFGLAHKLGELRARFEVLGASVHSVEELAAAQRYLRGEKLEGEKLDGEILDSASADCGGSFAESSAQKSINTKLDSAPPRAQDFAESKSAFTPNYAQDSNLDYVIVGHIFDSTCKPGVSPKGLNLLAQIRQKTSANIYAIGGINAQNLATLCGDALEFSQPAQDSAKSFDGVCMRSSLMTCENPASYIAHCQKILNNPH